MKSFFSAGIALAIFCPGLKAQYTQAWFSHINSKFTMQMPSAKKILATDDHIYVLATVEGSVANDKDVLLLKFSQQGNVLWEKRYHFPGNLKDEAIDMELDVAGFIYVTCASAPEKLSTAVDFCTIKYSPGGDELWTQRWGVTGHAETPVGIEVYRHLVFVSGTSAHTAGPSTGADFHSKLYHADTGKEIWSHSWNGEGTDRTNIAKDMTIDNGANLVVVGYSQHPGDDFSVIRYQWDTLQPKQPGDSIRIVLVFDWERFFNSGDAQTDQGLFVVTDASRNIYVTGISYAEQSKYDILLLKYSSKGELLWQARMNGTANQRDEPIGVAVDVKNNVVLGGQVKNLSTGDDFYAAKYDAAGTVEWATPAAGDDPTSKIAAMAVDGMEVFVTGNAGKSSEPYVRKYSESGQVIWEQMIKPTNGEMVIGDVGDMCLDKKGNVYFAGLNQNAPGGPKLFVTKYKSD
jgi:hypothetical protein